jgi:hypothetical protein
MFDGLNQSELLDLVEGELDQRARELLRARLAKQPAALARIDQMCHDRESVRALPDPELPVDFVSKLESLLARPMLIESPAATSTEFHPGEFRRQYRKRALRIRWSRLAAAAVIMLGLAAGLWAMVNSWVLQNRNSQRDQLAIDRQRDTAATTPETGSILTDIDVANLKGIVHHYEPKPFDAGLAQPRDESRQPAADALMVQGEPVPATFALVFQTGDVASAEDSIAQTIQDLAPERAALVRNFSFAEAQRIVERIERTPSDLSVPAPDPVVASSKANLRWRTPAELKSFANQVRLAMQSMKAAGQSTAETEAPVMESAHLIGPEHLGPTLEQQLDFSSRGAHLTVAVPVARLSAFIEKLGISEGQPTTLRILPPRAGDVADNSETLPASSSLTAWIAEGSAVRESIARLEQSRPDALVLVPVIVQTHPNTKK